MKSFLFFTFSVGDHPLTLAKLGSHIGGLVPVIMVPHVRLEGSRGRRTHP